MQGMTAAATTVRAPPKSQHQLLCFLRTCTIVRACCCSQCGFFVVAVFRVCVDVALLAVVARRIVDCDHAEKRICAVRLRVAHLSYHRLAVAVGRAGSVLVRVQPLSTSSLSFLISVDSLFTGKERRRKNRNISTPKSSEWQGTTATSSPLASITQSLGPAAPLSPCSIFDQN